VEVVGSHTSTKEFIFVVVTLCFVFISHENLLKDKLVVLEFVRCQNLKEMFSDSLGSYAINHWVHHG
jgi:hypothetical protein